MQNDYVSVTSVDVGSIHSIDIVLLVAGPFFMVRCLAGVYVADNSLDVVWLKPRILEADSPSCFHKVKHFLTNALNQRNNCFKDWMLILNLGVIELLQPLKAIFSSKILVGKPRQV
jgi:hypothetical protein